VPEVPTATPTRLVKPEIMVVCTLPGCPGFVISAIIPLLLSAIYTFPDASVATPIILVKPVFMVSAAPPPAGILFSPPLAFVNKLPLGSTAIALPYKPA